MSTSAAPAPPVAPGEGAGDSDAAGLGEAEVACKRNGSERTVLPSSVGPHWREPSSGLRPYALPLRSTTTSVPSAKRGAARTESPVWKGLFQRGVPSFRFTP